MADFVCLIDLKSWFQAKEAELSQTRLNHFLQINKYLYRDI